MASKEYVKWEEVERLLESKDFKRLEQPYQMHKATGWLIGELTKNPLFGSMVTDIAELGITLQLFEEVAREGKETLAEFLKTTYREREDFMTVLNTVLDMYHSSLRPFLRHREELTHPGGHIKS